MHEVKVYDSSGKLKKVLSTQTLKHTLKTAVGNPINVQEK